MIQVLLLLLLLLLNTGGVDGAGTIAAAST